MSLYLPTWNQNTEPSNSNIRQWMDNLYARFMPLEQARWNQSNIDTLFVAGCQTFVNRYFNFNPQSNQQYYFNILQQPINMVTGYQRQHRKGIIYNPSEGSDPKTTDQYTKLMTHVANTGNVHEQFSKSCELSAAAGLNLLQPYLDYTGDDPAQGTLKVKIWEYNSFLIDPYARDPGFEDAQFVWCQEYISKLEAENRFPDKVQDIRPMAGTPQRYGSFYFLPENYNMARNDLMVLSYVWYKWRKTKKRLYSKKLDMFFDMAKDAKVDMMLQNIPDLEIVNVEVPCWKLAVVLNEQLMYQGENPLGTEGIPFVPVYWNYDPHINYMDLRSRSLTYVMRNPQFLFNYKIIQNNDIAAATINAGWKRKVGAVANEDNLKKAGQGWDVIVNEGYELSDVEKIIPSAVPESDLALAQQMSDLIFQTSGINLENWSGQNDKQISSLTMMLKSAANLMVFQKYFDQWDYSLKQLGDMMLKIVLNNWNESKVGMIIGEEPTALFYSKIFAKYKVVVEESDLTPTQQNLQASQMMDINQAFGREVFPPSMIIPKLNITGKGEIIPYLQQQEEKASIMEQETQNIQHAFEDAKLKELYSKAASNIARAREDNSRAESNLGLYEERLSMIERNRALSLKEKQAALTALLENISRFGEIETSQKELELELENQRMMQREEYEKQDVARRSESIKFLQEIIKEVPPQNLARSTEGQEMQQQQMSSQNQAGMIQSP
jgi:hypothetical protein